MGVHERGGHDLEFLVTRQWFIKLLEHKQRWIDAGRRIRWHPEHMRARYENWIEGLNWDWNISRQRYYGVPFPVWYCRACDAPIAASAAQLPVDPQESAPPVATCPRCGGADFLPDPDVMDTWATSSISPQLCGTLLEPHGTSPAEFDRRYRPMTLRPNAHDIIRTWDFYTIVRSLYLSGDVPWTDVLISGHALDPSGKKISKSKLSVAEDPTSMLEQFSADAVRYWAASVRTGGDTNLSEEVFRNGNKLVTKLWNASKFALSHLGGASLPLPEPPPQQLNATDRWLLARLHEVIRRATAAMEDYEFAIAKAETERFFWTDLCDNYLELVKLRLYGDSPNASGNGRAPSPTAPAAPGGSLRPLPGPPRRAQAPGPLPAPHHRGHLHPGRGARRGLHPRLPLAPGPRLLGRSRRPRRRGGHPAGGRRRPALEGRAPAQRRRPPGRPARQRPPGAPPRPPERPPRPAGRHPGRAGAAGACPRRGAHLHRDRRRPPRHLSNVPLRSPVLKRRHPPTPILAPRGGLLPMADLNEMLNNFTRIKGVAAAALVGGDGLPLQSVTAPGVDESQIDVLGAIAASGLLAAQDIGQQTERGSLRQAIYEYERGVVVIEPLGTAILVVVTDAAANLGLLRLQARKINPALQAAVADL